MNFTVLVISHSHLRDCDAVCRTMASASAYPLHCLAQGPGLKVSQEPESSIAKGLGRQQVPRKSRTQVKGKKQTNKQASKQTNQKPSFQQFSTVLGLKPSPATRLGVGIDQMMHSKETFTSERDFCIQHQRSSPQSPGSAASRGRHKGSC